MRDKLRDIVKEILSEEFDAGSAFEFIRQKEGRAKPVEYVLSALKKGDIEKLNIPEDLQDDYKLRQLYKFIYAPELLSKDELFVIWDLDLSNTPIKTIPEGLRVNGYLDLSGCKNIKEIPKIDVNGGLYLGGCTSLEKLPEGLVAGDTLSLEGCTSLKELPHRLTVYGILYFKRTDPIPTRFGRNHHLIKDYIERELGGRVYKDIVLQ